MRTYLKLTLAFLIALIQVSCSDELCDNTCPTGFIQDINCDCVQTEPCAGLTCAEGEILTADCDCITDPNVNSEFPQVVKSGFTSAGEVWTKDNIYVLNGKVVVDAGNTLTIEAGTVIKAENATGSLASALIVAQGATIMANGTADEPIIFTSVKDEIEPGMIVSPNLTEADNQLWGGVVILGKAPISAADGDNVAQIEGIPADDTFGRYGGDDPADNSGVIKYISVRHGGIVIGGDNELNGITFGGVGNGTVVENIEVVANLDDGIEWFGGTVNCTNVCVAYGEDDGLDIDQNYAGTITNAIVITSGATAGDNAIEIDGPEGSLTDGFFTIQDITLIDKDGETDTAADLKSKTQGVIRNASWRGFGDNIKIRHSCDASDCSTEKSDSYTNYIAGNLSIEASEWVGNRNFSDWTTVYGDRDCDGDEPCMISNDQQVAIENLLSSSGNIVVDSPTRGADPAPFLGWSWISATNNL